MSETGVVRVFIPDPTHGEGAWSKKSIAAMEGPSVGPSALFRLELEAEYGEKFRFISIGTGAAMASYFVELVSDPYRAAGMAATFFFTGKAIREGFEAWGWMYTSSPNSSLITQHSIEKERHSLSTGRLSTRWVAFLHPFS